MDTAAAAVTAVIFVKDPTRGNVKTRLVDGGLVDDTGAAALALAMLACTVHRLAGFRVVIALTPDGRADVVRQLLGRPELEVVDQGPGPFGERLDRVWRILAAHGPVAFFATDTPDIPCESLRALVAALDTSDVAVGPTNDGGYWTLAADRYRGVLLRNIDWGSDRVYDQTCRQAAEAGLTLRALPVWQDVDRPDDVTALHRRLADRARAMADPLDEPLVVLLRRLNELLGDAPDLD